MAALPQKTSGRAYRQPVSYVRDSDVLLTPAAGAGRSIWPMGGLHGSVCAAATRPPGPSL